MGKMQMPNVPLSQLANDGRLTPLWMLGIITFMVAVLALCLVLHIGSADAIIDDLGWGLKIGFGLASAHSLGTTLLNKKTSSPTASVPPDATVPPGH